VYEFNPSDSSWTKKNDFPGAERYDGGVAFSIGSKGYVIGGGKMDWSNDNYSCLNDVWEYDPQSDTWVQKNDFPGIGRREAISFSMNGKGYVLTGKYSYKDEVVIGAIRYLNDAWEYDPGTDTWTQLPDLPGPARVAAAGGGSNNLIYVVGGWGADHELGDYLMFDLETQQWKELKSMNGNLRYRSLGFSYDGAFYITAGTKYGGVPVHNSLNHSLNHLITKAQRH